MPRHMVKGGSSKKADEIAKFHFNGRAGFQQGEKAHPDSRYQRRLRKREQAKANRKNK